MNGIILNIFALTIFMVAIIVIILLVRNKDTVKHDDNLDLIDPDEIRRKYGLNPGENYITPQNFSIGLLKQGKYTSMNDCNPDVLYPINGLDVNYGSKMPKCKNPSSCMQFIQPE